MNGEPKLMKMQNYSKKKLKDGMIKESKSVTLKSKNMFSHQLLRVKPPPMHFCTGKHHARAFYID